MQTTRDFNRLSVVLKSKGSAAALAYLNDGVPYRFSGVYRIEGDNLRNVLLFDKLHQVRRKVDRRCRFELLYQAGRPMADFLPR